MKPLAVAHGCGWRDRFLVEIEDKDIPTFDKAILHKTSVE